MFDLGKCILVTNNDRAAEKWGDKVEQVVLVETYEEVLFKDQGFDSYKPQASDPSAGIQLKAQPDSLQDHPFIQ